MPLSNERGEGYENRIAEELARDLGRRVEYTYFPQRMGFVRNTLRNKDERTQQFKCDVIIGVPKGYELTATTRPYMRSTYALVFPWRKDFDDVRTADDLLKLPPDTRRSLRIGVFGRSPGADWLLRNEHARSRSRLRAAERRSRREPGAHHRAGSRRRKDRCRDRVGTDRRASWSRRHAAFPAWRAAPFMPDDAIKFDYEISMGVRFGEKEWKETLDEWIGAHQAKVDEILTSYRVPLLDASGKLIETTAARADAGARRAVCRRRIPLQLEPQ